MDGKTAHTGTIVSLFQVWIKHTVKEALYTILQFGAAWSPDSKSIVTSSGDCTIKLCTFRCACPNHIRLNFGFIGDIETAKPTTSWQAGNGVENHQIGNTWTGSNLIISLNLAGVLNIFDPRTGEKPVRVIKVTLKYACTWNVQLTLCYK